MRSTTSQYRPALSHPPLPPCVGMRLTPEVSGVAPSCCPNLLEVESQEPVVPYAMRVRSMSRESTAAPGWGTTVAEKSAVETASR